MSEEEKCRSEFEERFRTVFSVSRLPGGVYESAYTDSAWRGFCAAWNLRQQAPEGWREFIENIATVGSEPLNSAVVYRALASRRHFMAELRNKARELLAEAPKPESVK